MIFYVKSEIFYANGYTGQRMQLVSNHAESEMAISGEQRRLRRLATTEWKQAIGWRISVLDGRWISLAQWGDVP